MTKFKQQVDAGFEQAAKFYAMKPEALKVVQQRLEDLKLLRPENYTPGEFNRATYDAVLQFQKTYNNAIRMLKQDTRNFKKLDLIDGKAGDRTMEAMDKFPYLMAKIELRVHNLGVIPTINRNTVQREGEALTEDAATLQFRKLVARAWEGATVKREGGGNAVGNQEFVYTYSVTMLLPDSTKLELRIESTRRDLDKESLRGLALAAIDGFGETGKLRNREPGKELPPGDFARLQSVTIIDGKHEQMLYSHQSGYNLKTKEVWGEKYAVVGLVNELNKHM